MGKSKKAKSVFRTLLTPLVALVLIEAIVLAVALMAVGVTGQLNRNAENILRDRVQNRSVFLADTFDGWADLRHLSEVINAKTQAKLDSGEITLDQLDSDDDACAPLLQSLTEDLIGTLYAKRLTGVFVVFNTQDLSGVQDGEAMGTRTGMYIRDLDPLSPPSSMNEDLLWERGSVHLVESSGIAVDDNWRPFFYFPAGESDQDRALFIAPLRAAYSAERLGAPEDYGYWAPPNYILLGSDAPGITYSMPLILDDGTIYGVVGVGLLTDYLETLLPVGELPDLNEGAYFLAVNPEDVDALTAIKPMLVSGHASSSYVLGETAELEPCSGGYRHTAANGMDYILSPSAIPLSGIAPFGPQNWYLIGSMSAKDLYAFSDRVIRMLALSIGIMLALGVLGSLIVSRRLSQPIHRLAQQVEDAQATSKEIPNLAKTGIAEIDRFSGAITALSQSVIEAEAQERRRAEWERDYDHLTGLMSRRAFLTRAEELFQSPAALGHTALLMLDLDNLKFFNDHYGHECGDDYVRKAAEGFAEAAPVNALCSRISGDEFFLLLYGYPDADSLAQALDRFAQAVGQNTFVPAEDSEPVPVSASGGVAFCPGDATDLKTLMKYADFAMYQTKRTQKGSIGAFDKEVYDRESRLDTSRQEFLQMVREEAVFFHFQPILDARTGRIFAYEALMRSNLSSLPDPGSILQVAQETGRLQDVEALSFIRAPMDFRKFLDTGRADPQAFLFINSIADQHMSPRQIERFRAETRELQSRIVVEITATGDLTDEAIQIKRAAPGLPGLFSLDNYGSGHSNDQTMLRLNPQFVKVGKSIIQDIDWDPDKQHIVSKLVSYAHDRGIRVIAGGIETTAELMTVLSMGVDYLQGFLFSQPAPVPDPVPQSVLDRIAAFRHSGV